MTANSKLIRELLLASAELPEAELAAFLAGPCGDGAKLRAAIELLLARLKDPPGNLDPGGSGSATEGYTQLSASGPGVAALHHRAARLDGRQR